MIKAIVFDWDGVIVDSMDWIYEAIRGVILSYGIEISIEDVANGFFQPSGDYYRSVGINESDKEFEKRYNASFKKYKKFDLIEVIY